MVAGRQRIPVMTRKLSTRDEKNSALDPHLLYPFPHIRVHPECLSYYLPLTNFTASRIWSYFILIVMNRPSLINSTRDRLDNRMYGDRL
jgi:hypothetical protein